MTPQQEADQVTTDKLLLPDFIIIGAMKCGTTTLYRYLSEHPQIEMSREKETDFFVSEINKHDCSVSQSCQNFVFGWAPLHYLRSFKGVLLNCPKSQISGFNDYQHAESSQN